MGATTRWDGALRPEQRDSAVPGRGRAVGRSDAGSRQTPPQELCVSSRPCTTSLCFRRARATCPKAARGARIRARAISSSV